MSGSISVCEPDAFGSEINGHIASESPALRCEHTGARVVKGKRGEGQLQDHGARGENLRPPDVIARSTQSV